MIHHIHFFKQREMRGASVEKETQNKKKKREHAPQLEFNEKREKRSLKGTKRRKSFTRTYTHTFMLKEKKMENSDYNNDFDRDFVKKEFFSFVFLLLSLLSFNQ